jgi:hypothetical protein
MLEAIRDHYLATGVPIAMKPAGGIRTAKQALQFLIAVKETLGDEWLNNTRYRFGASSLLNDLAPPAREGTHRRLPGPVLLQRGRRELLSFSNHEWTRIHTNQKTAFCTVIWCSGS